MPVVDAPSARLQYPKGLHLFHNGLSNCSQRVRIVLEEKSLPWESHHLDLMKGDHLSTTYQELHPKGVVPALMHEGRLVIESVDIIRYLDERFPSPPLLLVEGIDPSQVEALLKLCDSIQRDIKTLTYERLFKGRMPVDDVSMQSYRRHQQNQDLVKFREDFAAGFSQERIAASEAGLLTWCELMEQRLGSGSRFIAGEQFSLADVAANPNVHRLNLLQVDLDGFPNIQAWYQRQLERPSTKKAILDYEKPL